MRRQQAKFILCVTWVPLGVDNRNSHLVGFYARSRQEQHSEPVTSEIEGKLDQMAAMMQSQQEALSKFAMDNQALRMTVEALKEVVNERRDNKLTVCRSGRYHTRRSTC